MIHKRLSLFHEHDLISHRYIADSENIKIHPAGVIGAVPDYVMHTTLLTCVDQRLN